MQANPTNAEKLSESAAPAYIADVKAVNPDGDNTIEKDEFANACAQGLIKSTAATTGNSAGTAGKDAPGESENGKGSLHLVSLGNLSRISASNWSRSAPRTGAHICDRAKHRRRFPMEAQMTKGSLRFSRRQSLQGLALVGAGVAAPVLAKRLAAAEEKSLYERLGGVFAIAAAVDHFSDAVVKNPVVGEKSKNPQLREWHTKNLDRLPGLKFMRTLWVCDVSGGPLKFKATKPGQTPLGLEEAHRELRISPEEFDAVAEELGKSLDFAKVPKKEKAEVLAAFAAHKDEVTAGYAAAAKRG